MIPRRGHRERAVTKQLDETFVPSNRPYDSTVYTFVVCDFFALIRFVHLFHHHPVRASPVRSVTTDVGPLKLERRAFRSQSSKSLATATMESGFVRVPRAPVSLRVRRRSSLRGKCLCELDNPQKILDSQQERFVWNLRTLRKLKPRVSDANRVEDHSENG